MVNAGAEANSECLWYALHVRYRHERAVERALNGLGYPAFSPHYQMKRKRADRTKIIAVPLFPGYVFSHFQAERRLPILKISGVVSVVGAGNIPEAITTSEIESLQALVKSSRSVQPWPFLKAGHKIRIAAGALAGVEGILLEVKNQYRLIVSVTLLQRSVAVTIDQDSVVPF